MSEMRKITAYVPVKLLASAQAYTGEGVTETLRQGLLLVGALLLPEQIAGADGDDHHQRPDEGPQELGRRPRRGGLAWVFGLIRHGGSPRRFCATIA